MISEYVLSNQQQFKAVISKREKVLKILLKIQGLVSSKEQS
jgi:hypothetical protein